jgi:hypothetical protein
VVLVLLLLTIVACFFLIFFLFFLIIVHNSTFMIIYICYYLQNSGCVYDDEKKICFQISEDGSCNDYNLNGEACSSSVNRVDGGK